VSLVPLLLSLGLQAAPLDTVPLRRVNAVPSDADSSFASLGEPSVQIRTGQGVALIWLLRAGDSAFVVARISDSTYYWGDDMVISLDIAGDRGPVPGHDDFQWYLRRALDSSVVYRGRAGRWEPPRADPDWRLGRAREGGGWTVKVAGDRMGWSLILRLDGAWFRGEGGRRPAIAFRVYDDSPGGWFAWPPPRPGRQGSEVERVPDRWAVVGEWQREREAESRVSP
jgi:hypothetical protein